MKNLLSVINTIDLNPTNLYGLIQETDFEFAVKVVVLAQLEERLSNTMYSNIDINKLYTLHRKVFEQLAIESFKKEYK